MDEIETFVEDYREFETLLILFIFKKLKEGVSVDYLSQQLAIITGSSEIDRLTEALRQGNKRKVLAILQSTRPDLKEPTEAYKRGVLKVDPKELRPVLDSVIMAGSLAIISELDKILDRVGEAVKREYSGIVGRVFVDTQSGMFTREEAVQRQMKKLCERGIPVGQSIREDGVVLNYGIESSVRKVVNDKYIDTESKNQMNVIEGLNCDLIYVSQHLGARVTNHLDYTNHAHWQGRVYSRRGNRKYGDFYEETGYGEIQGLRGINCRHHFYPFWEGISKRIKRIPTKDNEQIYNLSQLYNRYTRTYKEYKRKYEVLGESKYRKKAQEYSKSRVAVKKQIERLQEKYK